MKPSGKSGHSSYSVLFLIFILGGAAMTAVFVTNLQEKTEEKRRIKKQIEEASQGLIEENYQNTSTTVVSRASIAASTPSNSETVSSLTTTNRIAKIDSAPSKMVTSASTQPANIPGYAAINRSSNVSRPIPVKNLKTSDGRRIAFP